MTRVIDNFINKKWPAFLLLGIFFVIAVMSMRHHSATSDEVAHIPSGYTYWKYFDYKINPEHPPLIKLWATLPFLFLDPALPSDPGYWERGDQWEFGRQFLYWSGNDADQLYFWSRFMIVIIGIVLGWYVFLWASELYGWTAGMLALALYVFDPNILAHSTIVQTDIPISAGIFILVYYFWKYSAMKTERFTIKHYLVLGILVGICFAIKYTGIYVIGFLALLYVLDLYFNACKNQHFYEYIMNEEGQKKLAYGFTVLGILTAIGFIVLITTYGFVNFNYYFIGLEDVVLHSTVGHPAYLLGMNSQGGWWYYFIVAFIIKTPIPTLLILAASFYLLFKTKKYLQRNEVFLLVPAALYFVAFMLNDINIGLRHILPVYPFLFVVAGSLATVDWQLLGEKIARYKLYFSYGLGVLFAWLVVANIMIYPYYLAYFNEFTGGPENGYKYLLDSNIDWGQALKETASWIDTHSYENQTIHMTYFGSEDPLYRGIDYQRIACAPTPGLQVISVNRLYDFMGNQYGCTNWLKEYDPIAVIGYSIFIYDIQDPSVIENYMQCKNDCTKGCAQRGEAYGDSIFKTTCLCICTEATDEELGII